MESDEDNETYEETELGQEQVLAKEDMFEAFVVEQSVPVFKTDQQQTTVKEPTNSVVPECRMEDTPYASGQANTKDE
ncbi:hypothetical protein HYC85_029019 [Camellia sinensis]|uniref:Uncharacterized protein n=1 Tax=Camellia sinensis TaxID=4442 RepID=A0A7J7FZ42_CAMSI|nr:hypothetical protein HYC85_029019 [Camellia sinensis]